MTSLLHLPPELLTSIFSLSTYQDLCRIRLVHSKLSRSCDAPFCCYLQQISVFIDEKSLDRALTISYSRFASAPRYITVSGMVSYKRSALHQEAELLDSGLAFDKISQILTNLHRCKSVIIHGTNPTLQRFHFQSGLEPLPYNRFDPSLDTYLRSRVVSMVFAAIDHCQRNFESIAIQVGECQPPTLELPGMRVASRPLFQLQELRMQVRISQQPSRHELRRLTRFVGSFSLLTRLGLEFVTELDNFHLHSILERLDFHRLGSLSLGNCAGTRDTLVGFLRRHRASLREVNLDDVRLLGNLAEWKKMLCTIRSELTLSKLGLRWCLSGREGLLFSGPTGCCIYVSGDYDTFSTRLTNLIENDLAQVGSPSEAQVRQLVLDLAKITDDVD